MKRKNIAFTVELLGLFILLLLVITVITQVFVMSRSHSLQARQLTEAVILAESTAEVSSSEENMTELASRLSDTQYNRSVDFISDDPMQGRLTMTAIFAEEETEEPVTPDPEYVIILDRKSKKAGTGTLAEDVITVYDAKDPAFSGTGSFPADDAEAIFTLSSSCYFGDVTKVRAATGQIELDKEELVTAEDEAGTADGNEGLAGDSREGE